MKQAQFLSRGAPRLRGEIRLLDEPPFGLSCWALGGNEFQVRRSAQPQSRSERPSACPPSATYRPVLTWALGAVQAQGEPPGFQGDPRLQPLFWARSLPTADLLFPFYPEPPRLWIRNNLRKRRCVHASVKQKPVAPSGDGPPPATLPQDSVPSGQLERPP